MKTEFTPGPWHIGGHGSSRDKNLQDGVRAWAKDSGAVAIISVRCSIGEKLPSAEMVANARLIAAAPDLFAALQFVAEEFNGKDTWLANKVRAALAKATGG